MPPDADPTSLVLDLDPALDGRARLTVAEALQHVQTLRGASRDAEARRLLQGALVPVMARLATDEALVREIVLEATRLGDAATFERALQCRWGTARPVRYGFGDPDPPGPTVVRWDVLPDRSCRFTLHRALDGMHARDPTLHFILMDRLVALLPLLGAYLAGSGAAGALYVNLGDEQHRPGISFCNHDPGSHLVPDSNFLGSHGYATVRAHHAAHPVAWADRRPTALWRGSTTGQREEPDVMGLDRVRLCLLGQRPEADGLLDAGLTALVQLQDPGEAARLEAAGLMRPFVAPERFAEWRYQIDIDGNTNSWPGLMQKLLTGSPVLKVASRGGWRQWYYGRLRPWENVVPVAADLSDLLPTLARLREDDALARRIGAAGAALAADLSYDAELQRALPVLEAAIADEAARVAAAARVAS